VLAADCQLTTTTTTTTTQPQAYGFAETAQQFDDWTKHRKMPIVMMMCGMLGKRARTHVLRITVDHQPRSSPPFKVRWLKNKPRTQATGCRLAA
jgi:hypothetical protein